MTIRTTIALAAATLLTTLVVPTTTAGAAPVPGDERPAGPRTKVTFTVEDCEGCKIQLTSALGTYAEADAGPWTSGAPGPAPSETAR